MGKEQVNHPSHYAGNGMEAIDVIEAFALDFALGNAVKYILRAGRKDGNDAAQDLRKAAWYLAREIGRLGGKEPSATNWDRFHDYDEAYDAFIAEAPMAVPFRSWLNEEVKDVEART